MTFERNANKAALRLCLYITSFKIYINIYQRIIYVFLRTTWQLGLVMFLRSFELFILKLVI